MNVLMVIHVKKVTVSTPLVAIHVTTTVSTRRAVLGYPVRWMKIILQIVSISMNVLKNHPSVKRVSVLILTVASNVTTTVTTKNANLVRNVRWLTMHQNVQV